MTINVSDIEIREKLLEHSYRLETMEKIAEQHNQELKELKDALNSFKEVIAKGINKITLIIVVMLIGAESAAPIMELLLGG